MRRSATPHNPGVSLFPFLAVLICTMGVMMLLLVVCNRPGADGADDGPAASGASAPAAIDVARDALSGKIARLESTRKATETDLAERRRRLSAEEQRIRKLLDDWKSVQSATANLEQVEHAKGEALHLTESQIAQLEQAVKRAKEQAGLAAERARNQTPWFAIVPYEGPNGTRRRPIYIECGPDRVTLQPEGVVLTIEDFAGPDGPGNPLSTILRAIRDYLAAGTGGGGPQGEPYPLLIVRPDGIELFYHARQAMASWATEFGYELIEQDRKLAYPPPNPQLAQIEQTALTDARARYAWFANTRTGRNEAAGTRPMYRASVTGGGIVREGGASPDAEGGVATNDAPPLGHGSGVGGPRAAFAGSAPGFAGPTSGFGNSGGGGFGEPRLATSQQASAGGAPTTAFSGLNGAYHSSGNSNTAGFGGGPPGFGDGLATGAAGGAFKGGPAGSAFAGSGIANGLPGGSVSPDTNGAPGASGAGGALKGGPESGMFAGTSAVSGAPAGNIAPAGNFAGGIPSGNGAASGAMGSDGGSGGDPRIAGSASGSVNGGGGGGGSGGNGGGTPGGADGAAGGGVSITMNDDLRNRRDSDSLLPDQRPRVPDGPHPGEYVDSQHFTPPKPKPDDDDPAKRPKSLADRRGRNWSLPSSAKVSVPVSRSIHIECRGDQLVILPDHGNSEPQIIPFAPRTEDSVDKLVAGVWAHTKGWGIAGRQMYWRPVLVLELGPSGEGRYSELQALMANSGLEVTRK